MALKRSLSLAFLPAILFVFVLMSASSSVFAQEQLSRILQGVETDDYPSVGIVGSLRNGGFCTGTLISPTDVLTAAHCAEVIENSTSGTFQLGDQVYQTSDIVIHPDYNSRTLANDLAILHLNEPVLDVPPSEIFRETPLVGDLLFIVGYGATGTADGGSDGTFGTKREGVTTIDEVTGTLVSWTFDDESEANTAAGDSGGPGFIDIDGDLFIACITSGGTEPDSILGDLAFNTRVDAFAGWIDLTTILLNESEPPVQDEPQDPTTDTPSTDDPAVDDTDGSQDFWSQPFPFLQLLFDLLTQLLDALSQFLEQSDGVTQPPVTTPPDTTTDTPGEQPAETPAETPVDCPANPPAETPDEIPTETPAETPSETPVETPAETPQENPATDPVGDTPVVAGDPPAAGPSGGVGGGGGGVGVGSGQPATQNGQASSLLQGFDGTREQL